MLLEGGRSTLPQSRPRLAQAEEGQGLERTDLVAELVREKPGWNLEELAEGSGIEADDPSDLESPPSFHFPESSAFLPVPPPPFPPSSWFHCFLESPVFAELPPLLSEVEERKQRAANLALARQDELVIVVDSHYKSEGEMPYLAV